MPKMQKSSFLKTILATAGITIGSWLAPYSGLESKVASFFSPQKAEATISVDVPVTLSKSASQASYEAINTRLDPNLPDYDPNDANEINWVLNFYQDSSNSFGDIDSNWPEDASNYPNIKPELISKFNIIINGNCLTFPFTHYIKNNNGKLIFNSSNFNGALLMDNCVKIDSTSTGLYAFVGSLVEDSNNLKEPNGVNLIEEKLTHPTIFTGAVKNSIYYDGSGGAQLIVAGCFFSEANCCDANSITLENIVYADISKNIMRNSGTAVLVAGESIRGSADSNSTNSTPILYIRNNDIEDATKAGIDFNTQLVYTTGITSNNAFTNCAIGIKNCENSQNVEITNNNFYGGTIPHEGEPVNDSNFPPEYDSSYYKLPHSGLIDTGIISGLSWKGKAPDRGSHEGVGCGKVDLNGDKRVNFKDYAVFMNHWLETSEIPPTPTGDFNEDYTVDMKDLAYFPACWCEKTE